MKRLKELRKAKGVSQQELADAIHVTQQSIFKYEHNLAHPDIDLIIACADFFDTSVDYLIGFSNVPTRYELLESGQLSAFECRMLEYYRNLSPSRKALIQAIVDEERIPYIDQVKPRNQKS